MIKCKTVRIKFIDKGVPQEEVSVQQVTGAQYIEPEFNGFTGFFDLFFKASNGQVVKQISYRSVDIKEYAITETIWEPQQPTLITPILTGNQGCSALGCNGGPLCTKHSGRPAGPYTGHSGQGGDP